MFKCIVIKITVSEKEDSILNPGEIRSGEQKMSLLIYFIGIDVFEPILICHGWTNFPFPILE